MRLKKFRAPSVREAIRLVKAELGPEALIVGTKKVDSGAGHAYEVTAAIDYDAVEGAREEKQTVALPGPEAAVRTDLDREIKDLNELLWTALGRAKTGPARTFAEFEKELSSRGFRSGLIRRAIAAGVAGLPENERSNPDSLRRKVRERLMGEISVADPLARPGVTAFVGPPGVGKTTTIAKLAAVHAIRKKKKTALLTMDTYRIAAAEQLRTYGRIMGLPVGVARTPAELAALINGHSDKEVILIDTAGRSRANTDQMRELEDLAGADERIRFNLVLSSQTRDDVLDETVSAYRGMPVDSLTFTKLDEGRAYGPIFNTMVSSGTPVAYLTTGQRVPEDIYLATRERLLNLFLPN